MNIKQTSELTGVSTDMLRYYEKMGLITPPRNTKNNYRDYSNSEIFNIVMIKQYSQLGLSLKAIKHLILNAKIETALSELEVVTERLKLEVSLITSRLNNALSYMQIFQMLSEHKTSLISEPVKGYYYPRNENSISLYNNLYIYGGSVKTVFRISLENLTLPEYPADQGMFTTKPLPDPNLKHLELPSQRYWCTVRESSNQTILNYEQLKPVLKQLSDEGYQLCGDIFLSQIMSSQKENNRIAILIECAVREV